MGFASAHPSGAEIFIRFGIFHRVLLLLSVMTRNSTHLEDLGGLYRRAFAEYGVQALWNMHPVEKPTPADALAITKALRTHGRMDGRRLAERIEALCRAHQ